jgi:ketosteroid isomerase-like protein
MTAPAPTALDDRTAIIDVTIRYCWAIDERDWDALADVFTPDAVATLGRECRGLAEIRARIAEALSPLDDSQHMVTNHQVHVDGDTATCRCYLQAQHVRHAVDGSPNFIVAGRYEDELVRTPAGWRIARRALVVMWREGNVEVVAGSR